MGTSTTVAIQNLNKTTYFNHKIFLTLDPAFNIGGYSPFFLEGKIRRISFGINEHIATAEIAYTNRPFGSRIGGLVLPCAVYIDNADNFVFRGFMTDEEGTISTSADEIGATCYDYKWFIGKFSKIRGKIYTIDNNLYPQASPQTSTVFSDPSLYEKFRMVIPGLNKQGIDPNRFVPSNVSRPISNLVGTGYIGTEHTVFNKNGDPDCSSNTPFGNVAFIYDSDLAYLRGIPSTRRRADRFFWNYATILRYVCANYITNVFGGTNSSTKVLINETSLSTIMQYGEKYGMEVIQPKSFDITNKSPMEAIDHVVKRIPGSWYWRILTFPNSVLIDIQNFSDPAFQLPGKYIFLGNGGKLNDLTNNQVNITSAKIRISAKDSISHAVAVGGPIDVETSVQYLPGWPQYIRPVSDYIGQSLADFGDDSDNQWDGVSTIPGGFYLSDFKGIFDYSNWRQYISKDSKTDSGFLRESVNADDQLRYAKIYRAYIFPENQEQITKFSDVYISDLLDGYNNLAQYLDQLFYKYILRKRRVKGPATNYRQIFNYAPFTNTYNIGNLKRDLKEKHHEDPPFVFLHDSLLGTPAVNEQNPNSVEVSNAILKSKRWIIPQEEKSNSFQFENENKVLIFQSPQFVRYTLTHEKNEKEVPPNFDVIQSRQVFATCRIECDVPLIQDKILNRVYFSNARLVTQEINEELTACIRVNAIFPNPSGFVGSDLDVNPPESSEDLNGNIVNNGPVSGQDSVIGSKLVDWNVYLNGQNSPPGILSIDDSDFLKQILQFLINDRPIYQITGDADLGRIDTSYTVGDIISGIKNSELSDGTGGYYRLGCVLEKLEYAAVTEKDDGYTTKISYRNTLPLVQVLKNRHRLGRSDARFTKD